MNMSSHIRVTLHRSTQSEDQELLVVQTLSDDWLRQRNDTASEDTAQLFVLLPRDVFHQDTTSRIQVVTKDKNKTQLSTMNEQQISLSKTAAYLIIKTAAYLIIGQQDDTARWKPDTGMFVATAACGEPTMCS